MNDNNNPDLTLPAVPSDPDASEAAKPVRRRAPRKRVAAADSALPESGADAAAADAEHAVADAVAVAPEVKPVRTRRKPALVAALAALDSAVAEPVAAPSAEAAPAPAPAAESPHDGAPAAGAVPAVDATLSPASPSADLSGIATSALPGTAAPIAGQAPSERPAVAEPAPPVAAAGIGADTGVDAGGTALAAAPAEGASEGDVGESGESGEAGRRNRRNRRRGRRGQERAEGEAGPSTQVPDENFQVVTIDTRAVSADDDDEPAAPAAEAPAAIALPVDAADTFAAVLSGDYDAGGTGIDPSAEAQRRVLAPEPDAPKLHKVLAQAGIGSRRDMEQVIADGQVQVNGQVAHTGQRVSFGDRIAVAGRVIKVRITPLPARVVAYHKVVGEVVTHDDPQQRPTVFRRLPRLPQGKWQSVGRLDMNTEGLLLFTNSGELANQLMHPRFGVEREYAVRVLGTLDDNGRARLLEGVEVDGQRASFKSIEDGGGEGVNRWYRVVITEGRNREVRKLFDKVGLGVSRLIRIRYGCVVLPRGLKRGCCVDLNGAEVAELKRLASPRRDGPRDMPRDGQRDGPRDGPRHPVREPRPPRPDFAPPGGRGPGGPPGQGGGKKPNRRNAPRPERPDRGADRPERAERGEREYNEFAAIPNPLMQTFDKRAIREARMPRREIPEDGPIPNPLEQTYDKRFVQKPRGPGGGPRKGGGGAGGQPDPMKTSLGYIGADAFVRKFQGNGGGGGGGGGGNRGGRRRGGR